MQCRKCVDASRKSNSSNNLLKYSSPVENESYGMRDIKAVEFHCPKTVTGIGISA